MPQLIYVTVSVKTVPIGTFSIKRKTDLKYSTAVVLLCWTSATPDLQYRVVI